MTIDSTVKDTRVHHFANVDDLRAEVENARIYGGDHFRTGGADGTRLGDKLANWALNKYFRKA